MPQPMRPATTSTAAATIETMIVRRRRCSRASCSRTIRLACLALTLELMGFLLPSPVRRGTQDVVVDADRGPGEQEQEHRDGQQGQVAHDVPEVRGPHPGGEVATGAEAATVDAQSAGPRRRDAHGVD